MANLSGSLSQIGNAVLLSEAATKFQEMSTAYGKDIAIETAYASEWDLYKEYTECFINPDQSLQDTFNSTIKGLVEKPNPTEADRSTLKNFFKNMGYGDFDYTRQTTAPGSDNLKWFKFQKFKTSWTHPFFATDTDIYAAPNTIDTDPRRTGKYVLIKTAGDSNLLKWLFQNSYKYGFVWYGPQDGAFMYIGMDKQLGAKAKKALTLGYDANMYRLIENKTGKAPETQQEVENYIKKLPAMDPAERQKYDWTHWAVVMNQV